MAVTFITGPMDKHRSGVNEESAGAKHRKANRGQETQRKRSNDYVARIARSTVELSGHIKYLTYLVVYSAAPVSGESKETGFSAHGASAKTSKRRTNSASSQHSTMSHDIRLSTSRGNDPFGPNNVLYPVRPDGGLRDVYVRELEKRVMQENNCDEGWHRGRIAKWFGFHLDKEIADGKVQPNFQEHVKAAVDLHIRMSTNPRIKQRDGVPPNVDELWRDVVDELNNSITRTKAGLKHIAGTPSSTFEDFLNEWNDLVEREGWNKKRLVLFQTPDAPRWPKKNC